MRRCFVCLILCVSVLLTLFIPVSADEYDTLRQQMKESFFNDKMLEISQYELTLPQVQAIYDDLYHSGQLPWFADEDCSYVYGENQTIARFRPKVLNPKVYDRDLYEQKVAELMHEACMPGMTDWQKAVSVHDHIILQTAYDEELEKNTGYDSLVGGSTVCHGYAMLYMDVMNRLGIPCQIVICDNTGEGDGHAWNIVCLEGQWYHVDLTWDDPVPDVYGFVSHEHFLRTDEELKSGEQPHDFDWAALEKVAEQSYETDDFLHGVFTPVCFPDAETAVYKKESGDSYRILSRNLETGEETELYRYDRKEVNLGHGSYLYPTLGMNYWNGRIYFNREDMVLSMLPDGSDVQEVYTRNIDDKYMIGCMADDGALYLTLADHDLKTETMKTELENVAFHYHSYHRNTVKASCQEAGYYEKACDCGVSYGRTVIAQMEHLMQEEVVKTATRQETGQIRHYCLMCDFETITETPVLPAPAPVQEEGPAWLPKWLRELLQ